VEIKGREEPMARVSRLAFCAAIALALGLAGSVALAMDSGSGSTPQQSPGQDWPAKGKTDKPREYKDALALIKEDKCAEALPLLEKALVTSPKDADIYNNIGFCNRKLGKYGESFEAYRQALTLDPNHKGAREYVGELYLLMDKLPEAENQLKQLALLCPRGCTERDTLAKAIGDYKAKHPPAPATP
jgi:tetratricopeptide (TPR) repeat protein